MKNIFGLLVIALIAPLTVHGGQNVRRRTASVPAAAPAGVFGSKVAFPVFGVDTCPASKILDKAIRLSGVNIFMKSKFPYMVTCAQIGTGLPIDSKVPFVANGGALQDACAKGQKVLCFGQSNSGPAGICIVNPRTKVETETYSTGSMDSKDSKQEQIVRPRFSAIYAFSGDSQDYASETSWLMDSNGCSPTGGNSASDGGSGPIDKSECTATLNAFFTGDLIYTAEIDPKSRYCDGKSIQPMWDGIGHFQDCQTMFPDLLDHGRLPASTKSK